MKFKQKILAALLLGTCCLLTIAAFIQTQKNWNWQLAAEEPMVKGQDVEGAELTIVEGGRSLKLKIIQVELDPEDPEQEIYLYTILYHNPVSAQWQNYCQPDRKNVAKAIPLSGHWDQTGTHIESERITFACTNGVLAKCVRFGYKPWKTVQGEWTKAGRSRSVPKERPSLRDLHQACTRMVRADYCGNGRSHTKEGTAIDIYDRASIQTRTPTSGMVFEAAWNPDEAVLIHRTRWPESLAQLRKECPERLKSPGNDSINPKIIQQQTDEALVFNDSFDRLAPVRLVPVR
jgi:ADYC domain